MTKLPPRYEDERGIIQDLVGPNDGVTYIVTFKDAIRGNHFHRETTQWTVVVGGTLLMATQKGLRPEYKRVSAFEIVKHEPGECHAWRAITDCYCIVISQGPRGQDYESDTVRLPRELRLLT